MTTFIFLLLLGFAHPTAAMADTISQLDLSYSTTTAPDIITAYAVHYGIEAAPLIRTLKCESGFVADAEHISSKERSYGVAQINLMAHPNVTKAEATNPFFAIDYAAREFSLHHQSMWTCYKAGTSG